jgi:hypothetical protein
MRKTDVFNTLKQAQLEHDISASRAELNWLNGGDHYWLERAENESDRATAVFMAMTEVVGYKYSSYKNFNEKTREMFDEYIELDREVYMLKKQRKTTEEVE